MKGKNMYTHENKIITLQQSGSSETKDLLVIYEPGSNGDGFRFSVFVEGRQNGTPANSRRYSASGVAVFNGDDVELHSVDEASITSGSNHPTVQLTNDGDVLKLWAVYTTSVTFDWKIRVSVESFA